MARVAYAVCGDAEAARDAVQGAWTIAWRRLPTLRDPAQVRAWLVAIAANEARQAVRKRGHRTIVDISESLDAAPGADPADGIGIVDLARALAGLKPDDRALLALRFVAGLDSTEIAAQLGMSASGVRSRLSRLSSVSGRSSTMAERDLMSFEARLADAFDRYVTAGAPVAVDARTIGAAVAGITRPSPRATWCPHRPGARRSSRSRARAPRAGRDRSARRRIDAAPASTAAWRRWADPRDVSLRDRAGCSRLAARACTERKVALRGCPRVVGNADAVATNTRFVGIQYQGFEGPVSNPISTNYTGGERWSPDSRTLALLNFGDGSVTFVSLAAGDVEHPVQVRVPLDLRGIRCRRTGSSHFDGSFSPDGRWFLVVTDLVGDGTTRRLDLLDVRGGDPRRLATLPAVAPGVDEQALGVIWTADDGAVALVSEADGTRRVATVSTTTGVVRWLDDAETAPASADLVVQAWSPDGSRIYVWADGYLWYVDIGSGEWHRTALTQRSPMTFAVADDGRRAAMVSGTTLWVVDSITGAIARQSLGSTISAWSPDRSALAVLESSGTDEVVRRGTRGRRRVRQSPQRSRSKRHRWALPARTAHAFSGSPRCNRDAVCPVDHRRGARRRLCRRPTRSNVGAVRGATRAVQPGGITRSHRRADAHRHARPGHPDQDAPGP